MIEHIPDQKVAITEYINEQWHCSSFCPIDHGKTPLSDQRLLLNESALGKHLVLYSFFPTFKKRLEKNKLWQGSTLEVEN